MEKLKALETPGESEENLIRRAVLADIESAMEVHSDEPFHNEKHPKNVGRDALIIVDIFEKYTEEVTTETRLATETGADIHDLIVDYEVVTDPKAFNYGQRVRFRGFGELMPENVKKLLAEKGETRGNEEKSWEKGGEIIKRRDPEGKVYNIGIMESVKEIVAATYPDAKMDQVPKEYITPEIAPYLAIDKEGNITALHFSQPFLKKESKISTLAVAWGDIMYGGKVEFERFKRHGNEEFRELYELIRKEILGGADNLTPERKSEIAKAALGWISTQVGFLLWQKIEFNNRLDNFDAIGKSKDPQALKKALSDEYSMFDSNVIDSVKRVENGRRWSNLAKKETFENNPEADIRFRELLGEMGF